jgi:hypothetical protein
MTTLYLVWHEPTPPRRADAPIAWDGDAHPLNDTTWLVRSDLTLSRLYHGIKRQLPEGSALLVAPLEDRPDGGPSSSI